MTGQSPSQKLLIDELELADGQDSLLALVVGPDGDVPAVERARADQCQLSGKSYSLSLTNAICPVGGWWAGVSHRHVNIGQTLRCKIVK